MYRKINNYEFNSIFKNNKVVKYRDFIFLIKKNKIINNKKDQRYGISFFKKSNLKKNSKKKIKRKIYWYLQNKKINWEKNFIILIKKYSFSNNKKKNEIYNSLIEKKIIYMKNK